MERKPATPRSRKSTSTPRSIPNFLPSPRRRRQKSNSECLMKPLASCFVLVIFALLAISEVAQVTTSQYDNSRTGATLIEKTLTPQNVNAKQFGKLGAFKVDGAVYAQPLFIPAVEVPGKGTHDVLFVATEHDSVYAFDANRPDDAALWHITFLDPSRNLSSVPAGDV